MPSIAPVFACCLGDDDKHHLHKDGINGALKTKANALSLKCQPDLLGVDVCYCLLLFAIVCYCLLLFAIVCLRHGMACPCFSRPSEALKKPKCSFKTKLHG